VEDVRGLVVSAAGKRDRALLMLLAKTGVRRQELVNLDLDDIDWGDLSIRLKPTPKRANCVVYFDSGMPREYIKELRGRRQERDHGRLLPHRPGGSKEVLLEAYPPSEYLSRWGMMGIFSCYNWCPYIHVSTSLSRM
jgi:integrase